jgi:hypothetical protein
MFNEVLPGINCREHAVSLIEAKLRIYGEVYTAEVAGPVVPAIYLIRLDG